MSKISEEMIKAYSVAMPQPSRRQTPMANERVSNERLLGSNQIAGAILALSKDGGGTCDLSFNSGLIAALNAVRSLRSPHQGEVEAVAWQHRGRYARAAKWTGWREGRNQSFITSDGDEFEERPLYLQPSVPKAGEVDRNALKRVHRKLAEEGGGTWATYMMIEIASAYGDLEIVPDDEDVTAALVQP